jgi:hypothetical protein
MTLLIFIFLDNLVLIQLKFYSQETSDHAGIITTIITFGTIGIGTIGIGTIGIITTIITFGTIGIGTSIGTIGTIHYRKLLS